MVHARSGRNKLPESSLCAPVQVTSLSADPAPNNTVELRTPSGNTVDDLVTRQGVEGVGGVESQGNVSGVGGGESGDRLVHVLTASLLPHGVLVRPASNFDLPPESAACDLGGQTP